MTAHPSIGVVAPSSQVPSVELSIGVELLKREGFSVRVHPQCRQSHWFFAGQDEERARAFFEFAIDPSIEVVWCARGGYGATRLLPLLERLTMDRGIPERKLLVGYSDATALLEFVRARWGWATLHAPMPGLRKFATMSSKEWRTLMEFVNGRAAPLPWTGKRLKISGSIPRSGIRGQLVGGNLSVWTALVGTPYEPRSRGKILFFEEIGESLPRIDRMVSQLVDSGGLEEVRAVVLGNFQDCEDAVPNILAAEPHARARTRVLKSPKPRELVPLRRRLNEARVIPEIFAEATHRYGIPLAWGLPAGHGRGHAPVPFGADYRLRPDGRFELEDWGWIRGATGHGS